MRKGGSRSKRGSLAVENRVEPLWATGLSESSRVGPISSAGGLDWCQHEWEPEHQAGTATIPQAHAFVAEITKLAEQEAGDGYFRANVSR